MAEIHVEKKRGVAAWVWAVLLIVVLAAVGYYLWQAGYLHASSSMTEAGNLAFASVVEICHGA